MSKYIEIYNHFLEKIKNNELKKGDTLPSENEIRNQFNVSKDTVKKALILLNNNGFIEKMQGKKSVVIGFDIFDFSLRNVFSFKEIANIRNLSGKTVVVTLKLLDADSHIKNLFNKNEDFKYFFCERYRVINGQKVSLDIEYILEEYAKGLTKKDLENSLYEYIENILNHKISYTEKTIYADKVSNKVRELLDIPDEEVAMLVEESKSYLKNGILFHITKANHRKMYRFKEIAKRGNKL